jgi:hypothetical protein
MSSSVPLDAQGVNIVQLSLSCASSPSQIMAKLKRTPQSLGYYGRSPVNQLTLQRLIPRIAGLYRSGPYCTLGRKQRLSHRAASLGGPVV